jgi:DNA-binding transcriptional LysR family regulator
LQNTPTLPPWTHLLTLLVEIIDSGNLSQAARKLKMTRPM